MTPRTRLLREQLEARDYIRVAGAHNALSARLVELAGFEGVWASGFEISAAHGVPDANILTMTEFLSAAEEIARAVEIPVIADCDTGFGNSSNVAHMVRRYEAAGVAAVCIEDKTFPKINSFIPGRQELASVAEFVGKIMAAKSAQVDPDFMVIARVESLVAGEGIDAALRRAHAYARAGADAILIHSKSQDPGEIAAFFDAWDLDLPMAVVPTTYFTATGRELSEMGASIVIYANHGSRAAVPAIQKTLTEILAEDSSRSVEGQIAPMSELFSLQGMTELKEHEATYLRTKDESTTAVILAAGAHRDEETMREIAEDIPIAMLDLNGKPLIGHQLDWLRLAGIHQARVVAGYRADLLDARDAEMVSNPEWDSRGLLHSAARGLEGVEGRALLVYGDILFEPDVVERLLKASAPVTLLVDRSFRLGRHRETGKAELVEFAELPIERRRMLSLNRFPRVTSVGKELDPARAHGEFAGLALLSEEGVVRFREAYAELGQANGGGRLNDAETVLTASFLDMVQHLIDRGVGVTALEITSGWLEIHSLDDYREACELLVGSSG